MPGRQLSRIVGGIAVLALMAVPLAATLGASIAPLGHEGHRHLHFFAAGRSASDADTLVTSGLGNVASAVHGDQSGEFPTGVSALAAIVPAPLGTGPIPVLVGRTDLRTGGSAEASVSGLDPPPRA